MNKPLIVLIICIFGGTANAASIASKQNPLKPFEFDDVIPSKFGLRSFNGSWVSNNQFIYKNAVGDLNRYTVDTGRHEQLVPASVFINNWRSPTHTISPDNTKLLIRYNVTAIFRHSIEASYAIYDINSGFITNIAEKALLNICVWSPNSRDVAFVKDNNVYLYRTATDQEVQLTTDGIPGVIYNGVPDWVYEEEVLSSGGALWFSPDGSKIAIASFDDREVEEFTYVLYESQYEKEISLRYPKSGRKNPTVTLKYINLSQEPFRWVDLDAPIEKVTADHILGSVNWVNDNTLSPFWLNRRQNLGVYLLCDTTTNVCKEAMEFSEPNGWIDVNDLHCTKNGQNCYLFGFNKQNWINIIKFNVATGTNETLFPRNNTVISIYGIDEVTADIYYLATLPDAPHYRHVFKNEICLTCDVRGPENIPCTYTLASFSKDLSNFALICSGPTPAYTKILKSSNAPEALITWEGNDATRASLENYINPQVVFLKVPVAGGFEASVKLTMPPQIDINEQSSSTKYPMVVEVYGGPNSVRISDALSVNFKNYQITSRHVIHCQIDGRGSGYKGKDLLFTINNKMGTVEIEDQIAVTKYLQNKYSFIDANNTGIWGWSYGGYATAMTLATDTEKVFQCGISVAPVTSWIYYDSIYTERYMGLPTNADNLANYKATDVTTLAKELGTHKFLLVHGNADDNVHFQQSLALTRSLVDADVDFDQVSYPNEAHSLTGVSRHLYHTIDKFWGDCLNLTFY